MITKTVHILDYQELDERVTKKYGRPYRTLSGMYEVSNDTDHIIDGVNGDGFWDIDYQEHFDKWLATPVPEKSWDDRDTPHPHPNDMLNFLVRDGELPPGDYVLQICW